MQQQKMQQRLAEMERRLEAAERRLAETQRLAHLGSWEWSIEDDRVTWSDELYRIFGLAPQSVAMTYEGYLERVHPEERERVREIIDAADLDPQPFAYETRIVRPDGTMRTIACTGEVEGNAAGRSVRMVGTAIDITEWRVAELRQAQMHEELASVIRHVRCILWTADVREPDVEENEGELLWRTRVQHDEAALQVLPVELAPGQTFVHGWHHCISPEDRKRITMTATSALRGGKDSYRQEYRCRDRYGEERWLYEDASIHREGPGHWRVIGVATDVTERHRAEEHFRHVMMGARCLIWHAVVTQTEEDDRYRWDFRVSNPDAAQQFLPVLVPPGGSYADGFYQAKLDEERELLDEVSTNALRKGESGYSQEYRVRLADGKLRWLSEDVQIETVGPGRFSLIGVCTDITERKWVEEALAESEARFRLVVESLGEGLIITDLLDRVLYANSRIDQMTGYSRDEMVGRLAYELLLPREEWPELQQRNEQRAHGVAEQYERQLLKKDGTRWWALIHAAPFRDSGGEVIGTLGAIADITSRKQMEEELHSYAARLERSNRELQEFAYVASHDLQEPLRKVQTFGTLIRERHGPLLDERTRDYLSRMLSASARMQTLIDDLLEFARVSTEAQPLQSVDLGRVARDVLSDLDVRVQETRGHVEIGELPTIEACPRQMRQLLQNLLVNALKYHRPGVPPVVRVHAEPGGAGERPGTDAATLVRPGTDAATLAEQVTLVVEDNGIGFDEKYAERVFLPFQRLHGRKHYEGSGIGLSTCRRIVERHGGRITAHSKPGVGSRFVVVLPVRS